MNRPTLPLVTGATIALLAACGGYSAPATPAPAPAAPASGTLYHRIGGYDALAAVVDDFLGRMFNDPDLDPFFRDLQTGEKQRLRQMLVDQLCEATGGPCIYVGKDMKTVHGGLGITEQDWNKGVAHLAATLDAFHLPARERGEILTAVAGLKDQIVGQ